MERKALVNEITCFYFDYKLINKSIKINEIKDRIDQQLEDIDYVESLIKEIIIKTSNRKDIDIVKLKELRLELEKIRLELEYKDLNDL